MVKRVTKDFETRSMVDLKKAGAYKYSLDPSTRPTCLAFKVKGDSTMFFLDFDLINTEWRKLPVKLTRIWTELINDGYQFSSHNAFFERCLYDNVLVKRYGWPAIAPRQRRCTAAKAAACALPRALGDAGAALNLRIQKDLAGHIAMMKICKPTRAWNDWNKLQQKIKAGARITAKSRAKADAPEPPVFLEYSDDPQTWETLYEYCKIDVRAEEALDDALPDLIPAEQEIWFLNQMLNWRGLRIDIPTSKKILEITAAESKEKLRELDALTMGLVTNTNSRKSVLEFLALEGIELPDLRARTVDDNLKGFKLSEDMHRLLEIRKALSMTSTRKYQGFIARANADDRVRDILLYHGAHTGRDTGTGIQPHNLPRGLLRVNKDRPYAHVENVVECDADMLKLLYGPNLSVLFSAILRNMIIPSDGHELFVADFSKIEVAVLWWLADNKPGLKILREGRDPYIYQAAANTGKTYEQIAFAVLAAEKWAEDARQLGKAQILGGGFGMGWPKFQTTAHDMYRLKLTDEQSQEAIRNYRTANAAVPILWKTYEEAAIRAVRTGKRIRAGKCLFFVEGKFFRIQLPSGRCLFYCNPQISWRIRTIQKRIKVLVDGVEFTREIEEQLPPQETLEYWAVDSKTKKWSLHRTWGGTLTENIVQAVARDLMMPAMVRLEKNGYRALLMVHDEGITEKPVSAKGRVEDFIKILCEVPPWAPGLPLSAQGWSGPRYRK